VIHTAQDVVDYLLSATGGGAQDGEHRALRQAVIHGVREVLHARDWLWHTKVGTFTIQQTQTTGSLTAGQATITVANAAGIYPGRILDLPPQFFTTSPRVVSVAGNVVTVDKNALASGTGITVLVQTYYDLPPDLRDLDALVTDTVGTLHTYITPQEWQRLEVNTRGAGEPFYYTVMRSDINPDRYQIRFVGVPTNSVIVHYTYRYQPKMVKYMGYEPICRQGTVLVANATFQNQNSSLVVGSGTAFQADMLGAMIRLGTSTADAEPIGALQPFSAEAKIVDLINLPNQLMTLPRLPVHAAFGVKYAISDIIDCSPQMYTAVLSASEMWYARLAGKPGGDVVELFNRDLRLAMERDVVQPLSGRPGRIGFPTPRSMGYYSAQQSDQGT
jgi:hypothetical protein